MCTNPEASHVNPAGNCGLYLRGQERADEGVMRRTVERRAEGRERWVSGGRGRQRRGGGVLLGPSRQRERNRIGISGRMEMAQGGLE